VSTLSFDFLQDGSRRPADVAAELVSFVRSAMRTLDVAIYDFQAGSGATASVAEALEEAARRGVSVRLVFNVERESSAGDPRSPRSAPERIDGLDVPTRGVSGNGALMHHKYVVRDAAHVWTGSTNWTDDAFGREENVVVRVESEAIAAAYGRNFGELWERGRLEGTGARGDATRIGDSLVQPLFSPDGPSLAQAVASRIGETRSRVRLASPVITSGPILGTLAEMAGHRSFDLAGAYDLTQMEEVDGQWRGVPANQWKREAWEVVRGRLVGKRSTPYGPNSVHDYMHAKAVVVDGEVLTGSYNCSHGGEENAENVLWIQDRDVADRFAAFIDDVVARYGSTVQEPPA
jgi:phosphatidylserine/phosphatidylglycerophosphate/cardiolipin synthase-like enzyme